MVTNKIRNGLLCASVISAILLAIGADALADTYTYDELGRLTGITYSDGSSVTYVYDAAGNRITVTQAIAP